jgi:hypothetical protein
VFGARYTTVLKTKQLYNDVRHKCSHRAVAHYLERGRIPKPLWPGVLPVELVSGESMAVRSERDSGGTRSSPFHFASRSNYTLLSVQMLLGRKKTSYSMIIFNKRGTSWTFQCVWPGETNKNPSSLGVCIFTNVRWTLKIHRNHGMRSLFLTSYFFTYRPNSVDLKHHCLTHSQLQDHEPHSCNEKYIMTLF